MDLWQENRNKTAKSELTTLSDREIRVKNIDSRRLSLTDEGVERLANESRELLDKLLSGLESLLLLFVTLIEILEVSF